MALAAGAVAGIAIGCAVVTLIAGFFIGLRVMGNLLDDEIPKTYDQPAADIAYKIKTTLPRLDYIGSNGDPWYPHEDIKNLQMLIDQFVLANLDGPRPDADTPLDPDKLRRLAGGDFEDWEALVNMEPSTDHTNILCHFIARVLWHRMIPDGDPSISLLPTEMLTLWQHLLNKKIPAFEYYDDTEEAENLNTMLRQQWRYLTVLWGSDRVGRLWPRPANFLHGGDPYLERKGHWGIRFITGAGYDEHRAVHEDDARMPKILAVEEVIKDALAPLVTDSRPDENGKVGFESAICQQTLREITSRAADIALCAFGQAKPHELYWPKETLRPGVCVLRNREGEEEPGHLVMFGCRHRTTVPGCDELPRSARVKTEQKDRRFRPVKTFHDIAPIYHDSEQLENWVGLWYTSLEHFKKAVAKHKEKEGDDSELPDNLKKWKEELEWEERKGEEYFAQGRDPKETDGWEPAHQW